MWSTGSRAWQLLTCFFELIQFLMAQLEVEWLWIRSSVSLFESAACSLISSQGCFDVFFFFVVECEDCEIFLCSFHSQFQKRKSIFVIINLLNKSISQYWPAVHCMWSNGNWEIVTSRSEVKIIIPDPPVNNARLPVDWNALWCW